MLLFENKQVATGAKLKLAAKAANPFMVLWPRPPLDTSPGHTDVFLAVMWDVESQYLHWLKRMEWRDNVPAPKAKTIVPYVPLVGGHTYTFALFRIKPGQQIARINPGKRRTNWDMTFVHTLFPLGVDFTDNVSFEVV